MITTQKTQAVHKSCDYGKTTSYYKMMELASEQEREVERLTQCLKRANIHHEYFERLWYLRGDAIAKALGELEAIRTEQIAVAGYPREATAISAARVILDAETKCQMCNGRGEIGGITASDPGGCSEPCPECNSKTNAEDALASESQREAAELADEKSDGQAENAAMALPSDPNGPKTKNDVTAGYV